MINTTTRKIEKSSDKLQEQITLYNNGNYAKCISKVLTKDKTEDPLYFSSVALGLLSCIKTRSIADGYRIARMAVDCEGVPDVVLKSAAVILFNHPQHSYQALCRLSLEKMLARNPEDYWTLKHLAATYNNIGPVEKRVGLLKKLFDLLPEDDDNTDELLKTLENLEDIGSLQELLSGVESGSKIAKEAQKSLSRVERNNRKHGNNQRKRYPSSQDSLGDDFSHALDVCFDGTSFRALQKINRSTPIFTAGSCFAGNLAHILNTRGYKIRRLPLDEDFNTTFANLSFFGWLFDEKTISIENTAVIESLVKQKQLDKSNILHWVTSSKLFVITVGQAQLFFDKSNQPLLLVAGSREAVRIMRNSSPRLSTVEENYIWLNGLIQLIQKHNPNAQFLLTLSPVPLNVSFVGEPALVADCLSKSTLRLAINKVLDAHSKDVGYFPAFEMVRFLQPQFGPPFGTSDGSLRHVGDEIVSDIVSFFTRHFIDGAENRSA